MTSPKSSVMIADTCIIIDFKRVDPTLFSIISRTLGPLSIAETLLEELEKEFSKDIISDIKNLGIDIVPVYLADLAMATKESQTGPLSVYDRVCFYTAKRWGYTCITNDKKLRAECEQHKVKVLWGLDIIVQLYQNQGITRKEARRIGKAICTNSHGRITREIYEHFLSIIMK